MGDWGQPDLMTSGDNYCTDDDSSQPQSFVNLSGFQRLKQSSLPSFCVCVVVKSSNISQKKKENRKMMVISIKYDQPKHFAKMKVQFITKVVKCRGEICAFRTMLTRLIYVCVVFPIAEIMSCKCADERLEMQCFCGQAFILRLRLQQTYIHSNSYS